MLNLDIAWPLAIGQPTVTVPPERFVPQMAVGYKGPNGRSCGGAKMLQLTNATTQACTGSMTWDYMTSVQAGTTMTDFMFAGSIDMSWQISNTNTTSNSQTAMVWIPCASAAYTPLCRNTV
jgi:hypothetical protein